MNHKENNKEWRFKALTDIWTGDAYRKGDRLIPTGLLGSIRWWFEVLVRGLGGKACDPSVREVRCSSKHVLRCVVCELFGCTGWARKFRLMVLDSPGNVIQNQIKAGTQFTLRFIPLRPIRDEEWCLLDLTLRLIADYGAIGGKTVLKPSDEQNRQQAPHHRDYGLIQYTSGPEGWQCEKRCEDLKNYVEQSPSQQWRKAPHTFRDDHNGEHDFSWASLENFWYVKGWYLARHDADTSTFNQVIGRRQPKSQAQQLEQVNDINRWLAGHQQESKKVFSFKHPQEGRRTFGFVKPGTVHFNEIERRLKNAWPNTEFQLKTGDDVLRELCGLQGSNH